jgi:hypothetical protein
MAATNGTVHWRAGRHHARVTADVNTADVNTADAKTAA